MNRLYLLSEKFLLVLGLSLFLSVACFAAPKAAGAYYSDAAFQYIENRLPTAEITCNEGLQYYPNDQKLQMLLDRIKEAKDEQKNENKKNDKNQDQQDQQNSDQNQDQNSGDSSSSQEDNQQNQDQNQSGASSSSVGESSDSNGGADEQQPEPPKEPEQNSSDSQGNQPEQPQEIPEGQMDPADAAQLLKDFDEQNGERKPWKPVRGQARPAKDW